jgi:hypothetical protein
MGSQGPALWKVVLYYGGATLVFFTILGVIVYGIVWAFQEYV